MYYSFGSLTWNFQLKLYRAPTSPPEIQNVNIYQKLENIFHKHQIFSNVYLELAAACGAPPLLELGPGRARLGGRVWGRGGGGAARRTSSRCVTICHEVMSWLSPMLCDYVMSALRGDQARTARCLRRGSAARRDQELPPARVCRAPISGTIALLNIHLQI